MSEPTQRDLRNIQAAAAELTSSVDTLLNSLPPKTASQGSELPVPDLDPQIIIDELNESNTRITDYLAT